MWVLQNNQNNAMAVDTEICYCLTASMGMGGGYVPMIVSYGLDTHGQGTEKETAFTIRDGSGGGRLDAESHRD